MKKLLSIFLLICTLTILSDAAMSQITVTGSTGADGSYTDLTGAAGAFFAINSSAQTGNNITISITADVLSEPGLTSLNANDWTTLTISPSGGAARTISGAVAGTLIDLNGADNVTINGLNTGGNSLTISNTATGGVNTIRFIADATNNTVTNCTILGSTTFRSRAVVLFSTGTTTGNDNNSIDNCIVTSAGSNLPVNGIASIGTSATIENNLNTINACNISDYFKADSVTNGILLGTGNSSWVLTNNRLFQTANRIYTTGNTHNGINITSGSGYTITGNVIGYANASGTGTTNMVGMTSGTLGGTFPSSYTSGGTANATRYVAINCNFVSAGAVSSIQNNNIGGFALYTSSGATSSNGVLCGINVTSGNANIGTVTGNTISSMYAAVTTSGGMIAGIFAQCTSSGSNAISIQNNYIHSLDAMGNTASNCGSINGIACSSSGTFTVTNNTIGSTTNPNLRMGNLTEAGNLSNVGTTFSTASGFGAFRGILNSFTSANNVVSNNIIRNASLNSTSTSTSAVYRGIEHSGSTGATTISGNSVSNLTGAVASTSMSGGALSGIGIYITSSATGISVTQNTINGLSLTNTTTSGTNVAGISISSPNTLSVSRNIIYDLINASTSTSFTTPGTISGIFIRNGAVSPMNIFNNMITLGNSVSTNTCIVGIWGNHAQLNNPTTNIYYNSVHITGTVTSGDLPSFGYLRGDLSTTARTPNVDIRNNIFNNERTGGIGKHYAISNNYGATASNTGWGVNASNFNVLNSASSSTVGYWNSDQTLGSWRTASGSDVLSLTGVPITFLNTATGDLHINMGLTPTQLESGGIVIAGYSTDIDGQTRPGPAGSVNGGAWAPDFGADEFDGVPNDLTAPLITYNLLLNSSCLISRDLSADIFDGLGVNTAPGTKPRVYYKKSTNLNTMPATNDNTTDGWKYAEASNSTSPFNFTINYSNVFGGVASGDVLEYFVIAQDINSTPNVGVNTGTFTLPPASVALVASNFPISGVNSFNFTTGLGGLVTIGVTGTYTTLTDAGGLFEAINTNGLSSNLTAEILDPSITETGLTALNSIALGCASGITLTIKPASGVTTILTGSNAAALIDLNSADNVIFDGSNNGTGSKDMTIRNTGTGATIRLINGASNDVFKNCIIESQNASTTGGTVFFSTSAGTTGNSNNEISNCDVRDRSDITGVPANAIYSNGSVGMPNAANKILGCNVFNYTNAGVLVAATGAGDGWVINPSNFYQTAPRTTKVTFIGINGGNGHSILNNYIGGTAPGANGSYFATTVNFVGIELNVGSLAVTNVQGNTIRNIRSSNATGNPSYGINISTGMVDCGNISGNYIGSTDTAQKIDFNFGGSVGIVTRSSNPLNVSNNTINNIHMPFNVESSGVIGIYMEQSAGGSCIVKDNTVTNMTNGSRGGSPLLLGPSSIGGIYIFVRGVNTISGNVISNIGNIQTQPGASTNNVLGLAVLQSLAGTVVEKNRISNLYGTNVVTGNNADNIRGILVTQQANATIFNNTVSLDAGTNPSDKRIVGISEESGPSSTNYYYYNSVNIYGTSSGSNNTYAFSRGAFYQTNVVLMNNSFANMRTATTGSNIALANEVNSPNTANGWPSTASNYNALYTLNSATATKWGAGNFDLAGFQNVTGGDSYTLFGNPGYTSNTDLLPDGTNNNCWTLKGNGIAISTIGNDIVGTLRSTSIVNGGTDIGAYEFPVTVQPPTYNNATASTGLYKFIHAQDTMAAINVTTLGTLADLNVQYYSGENPPGLATTSYNYGNVYWEIYPTSATNSGYTYDLTLRYSPALIGTISSEGNIKVAKNTLIDTQYIPFTVQGTGPGEYQIDTAKNLITVYGLTSLSRFILTDSDIPLPVEMASFTSSIKGRDVSLNWTTSSETNNSGFEVERKAENGTWMKIGNVAGNGTTTNISNYSYTDKNLATGKYEFRLKQVDFNGNYNYFNLSNEVIIGAPDKFELSQNYPNPFNPTTKINYAVPVDGRVSMKLYDISGREIVSLVNDVKTAGYYTVTLNASNLASGTYFYRMSAEGNGQKFIETKKMVVIK